LISNYFKSPILFKEYNISKGGSLDSPNWHAELNISISEAGFLKI
jgi:hypothetical protein